MDSPKWYRVTCASLPAPVGKTIRIVSENNNSISICGIKVFGYESLSPTPEPLQGIVNSIDIDLDGNVYTTNKKGLVHKYNGTSWSHVATYDDLVYIDVSYGINSSWAISRNYP
jgi:hypothetical protein